MTVSESRRTTISFTVKTAAEATGLSERVIQRAIKAGDLRAMRPRVDGREIAKDLITAAELERWIMGAAS